MVTLAEMETEWVSVSVSGGVNAPSPLRCHLPSFHSITGSLGHDLLRKGPHIPFNKQLNSNSPKYSCTILPLGTDQHAEYDPHKDSNTPE